MGKQQLSTLDVAAEVACLRRRIVGMHVINVFDINSKTYVLKFGTSGESGEKVFVVLESGCRLHTTQYERPHSNLPSNFNLKLRKHIRKRRLNDVRQLGVDRIVDFVFGHEDKAVHLILEMYAQGNIVLTDHQYQVLTLLRTHSDAEQDYYLMPKKPYPVQHIRMPKSVTETDAIECFFKSDAPRSLKAIITELLPFGSACAEHVLLCAGLDPAEHFPSNSQSSAMDGDHARQEFINSPLLKTLMVEIKNLEQWFHTCADNPSAGFILTKETKTQSENVSEGPQESVVEVYTEYEPFLLQQHKDRRHLKFDSFDAALDEFFSKREEQKMLSAEAAAQSTAEAKLLKTKQDLEMRAEKLHEEALDEELQGQLIEYNLAIVDEVLLAVNSVLASGVSWDEVESLIKDEAQQGNPVANRIHSLQLEQNSATILLKNFDADDDDDEGEDICEKVKVMLLPLTEQLEVQHLKVVVDLSLGAAANARMHYEKMKRHSLKEQKTYEANETAIKAAEKKVQAQLKKNKTVSSFHQLRKTHWFEKFDWFITTENYLVISGKDAQQNELLVKRYMGKDDVYVHADLHGASTTIIKNYRPGMAIPPVSLQQAGAACVCRSKAWDGRVITSAWWVYPDQVSKTAPTGEYLVTGSFMVRGKKNYLPPASLTYGFGFLFKLEESSIAHHKDERAPKADELLERESVSTELTSATSDSLQFAEKEVEEKTALDAFLEGSADHLAMHLQEKLKTEDTAVEAESAVGEQEREEFRSQSSKMVSTTERGARSEKHRHKGAAQKAAGPVEQKHQSDAKGAGRSGKKKSKRNWKDEEDWQLMTELLQSAGEKKTKQQRRQERKQKKASKRAAISDSNFQGTKMTSQEIEEAIAKATETPFMPEQASEEAESSEAAEDVESLSGQEEEEEEAVSSNTAEIQQLESLTGNPLPEDVLLFAVPFCGPYDALASCKYKVKLLPGPLKKGKAGKQARELLTHGRNLPQRDIQLMRNVPDTEITHAMLGSVKLAMPGMQKIKQSQKSKKHK